MKHILLILPIVLAACSGNMDTKLNRDIKAQLSQTPNIGEYDVVIEDMRGSIKLTGTAASPEIRSNIENRVRSVDGVASVANSIEVVPSETQLSSPAIYAKAQSALNEIRRTKSIQDYNISVLEAGNNLILNGQVGSPEEAARILTIARQTKGVNKVTNNLEITGPRNDREVKDLILRNIGNQPNISLDGVTLEVKNGIVNLSGTKSSTPEVDSLLAAIIMTKGVKDIKSAIKINGRTYVTEGYIQATLKKSGERSLVE